MGEERFISNPVYFDRKAYEEALSWEMTPQELDAIACCRSINRTVGGIEADGTDFVSKEVKFLLG